VNVFRRILKTAQPYRHLLVAAFLLLAVGTLLEVVAFPALTGGVFLALDPSSLTAPVPSGQHAARDQVASWLRDRLERIDWLMSLRDQLRVELADAHGQVHWLLLFCGGCVLIYALRSLCVAGYLYLNQYISQHVMKDLRAALYGRLLGLPMSFYESRQTGELMSRMTSDIALVQNLVSVQLADAVVAAATIVGGLTVMLLASWQLTLLALVMVPAVSYVIGKAGFHIRAVTRVVQQRVASMNARLQERIGTINTVQSFTREEYEIQQFDRINRDTVAANLQAARIAAPLQPAVEFMGVTGMVLGLGLAGWFVIHHQLSIPVLVVYVSVAQRVGAQFSKLGRINLGFHQGIAAGARVMEVLDRESDIQEAPDAKPLPPVRGEIIFQGVSFRYAESEDVLREINLTIAPGEVVALVGPSGGGKSSLTKLIPRFYDVTEGALLVDGNDVRGVTLHSLRSQIGIVPQETVLFTGSIRDNIAYGRLEASQEEIEDAARAANAHDFIVSLPMGYATEVGERGTKLSGGQRQRVAIARTLLKNPRILILDEATSSLDTESEQQVQEALERLMADRTTVVIAHRLSTVRNAHRIVVLDGGRIVEIGSHAQLLRSRGLYRKLYEMQFRDQPDLAE